MATVLEYFDSQEIKLCLRINRAGRHGGVRRFFAAVSKAGDGGCWLLLGIACLFSGREDALPFVLQVALTGAAGVTVYRLLKERLVRERPCMTNAAIVCGTAPLDRYSFPSGHTLHAVSFTMLFTHFDPLLLAIALPLAVLIALSRIVLGLHYPTDVIAGAAIGAALASISLLAFATSG